jgi:hypothetical protein
MQRVQDQRRDLGVPVPDERTAKEFLEPIMQQIVAEHAEDRRKDLVRAPDKPRPPAREWYKDPDHSPRMTDIPGTRGEFICEELGTVKWDLSGNVVVPDPGFKWPTEPKHGPTARAVQRRFRELAALPEWRERLKRICFGSFTRKEKEAMYRNVLADSVRLFGSPLKERQRRIQVG